MKKILFFLCLLLSAYAAPPLSQVLYDDKGNPSEQLCVILNTYGIQHDGHWETIVKETQKHWLRTQGKERWEVEPRFDEDGYELFSDILMVEQLCPGEKHYEYAVVLGATLPRVKKRLAFLVDAWSEGVRFNHVVFLTGDRRLNEEEIDELGRNFTGLLPKNETEMMVFVYRGMDLKEDLRKVDLVIVDAPQKEGKRPNTKDTFVKWLEMHPRKGSALIISDQPFLGRADTIAREFMRKFPIETVGEGFSHEDYLKEPKATPILLDELARWIYEEYFKRNSVAS